MEKTKEKMKLVNQAGKSSKPVKGSDKAQRCASLDCIGFMKYFVEPNFPEAIQANLNPLDDDLKKDIKELFNYHAEKFGDLLFTAKTYE